jgi:hypothetical protein
MAAVDCPRQAAVGANLGKDRQFQSIGYRCPPKPAASTDSHDPDRRRTVAKPIKDMA